MTMRANLYGDIMKSSEKPKESKATSIIQNIVCVIGWLIVILMFPIMLLGVCSGVIKK